MDTLQLAEPLRMLITLVVSFLVSALTIPTIVKVAREKKLMDKPNERSSHKESIPTLGGIAIFSGILIASLTLLNIYKLPGLQYTIVGIFILFMIGITDDMLNINPYKKLGIQVAAALLVIIKGDIGITNFHGLFGIYDVDPNTSLLVSTFVIVAITNAFNLIDGIDGLAGSVGIVTSLTFGFWFMEAGEFELAVISFALTGALAGFLIFNLWGQSNKIFMGDTGSLVVGYLLAVLVIKFNEVNINSFNPAYVNAAPAVSFAILIIPLFDTIRVTVIRLAHRQHPFRADRRHIHHRLLDLGLSHKQASTILATVNLLYILVAFILQYYLKSTTIIFALFFAISIPLSTLPVFIKTLKDNKLMAQKQIID
ncbi:MAG: undecaprenyl/decaprenyl-phosphate alpha-N-acetylglucosaminyl 1-phosphate transferase [Sphingobacteriia bacterium]|nr:undecaprenyl/decaprenyl-phosphate alpha-N-acetylglucosaminyl 1-phosphate transferase [Sphingobacteriia bacterium]